jgi:hypothetical protein
MSNAVLLNGILRNLVSNAIKYTEPKGRILIGCRRSGQNVRIDVCDTGIGITSEQLSRLFEAFTRLDSTRCDGLGVGLFIVRRAIEVLGHRIDVCSAASRGPRFPYSQHEPTPQPDTRVKHHNVRRAAFLHASSALARVLNVTKCRPAQRWQGFKIRKDDMGRSIPPVFGCARYRRLIAALYAALCLSFTCLATTPLVAQEDSAEGRRACTPDVFKLCREFVPDADRITICLQQQKRSLSVACRKVIASQPVAR